MRTNGVTLSKRLNCAFLIGLIVTAISSFAAYYILSWSHEQHLISDSLNQIENTLEGQMHLLTQEFINDRFYAIALRGQLIQHQYNAGKLEIGLYRSGGETIYESSLLKTVKPFLYKHKSSLHFDNKLYVFKEKNILFSGQNLGHIIGLRPVDFTGAPSSLKSVVSATSIVLFLVFIAIFVSAKIILNLTVVTPLKRLIDSIPSMEPYIDGGHHTLDVPTNLGTKELDEVAITFRSVCQRLRQSIDKQKSLAFESQRRKAMADIAKQIAHDIRSPIAALEVIQQNVANISGDYREILGMSISRIKNIANDILDNCKNDKNALPCTPLPVGAAIESLVAEMTLRYSDNLNVLITTDLDWISSRAFCQVPLSKLKRVLANLISNSVEAIPSNRRGWVKVKARATQHELMFKVIDNGKGISKHMLPKIASEGFSQKSNGFGLGLYQAKQWIEAWHGSMTIQSVNKIGTVVSIRLPKDQQLGCFIDNIPVTAKKIIVLDDDKSVFYAWKARFKNTGTSLQYFDCVETLNIWIEDNGNRINDFIFLVDYELGNQSMNGLQLIEKHQIHDQSILVTNRFEEETLLNRCLRLNLKMLPKNLLHLVPICSSYQTREANEYLN